MKRNNQISSKQIRGLMVSTMVGIGIIGLPQRLTIILENDGWIAILLGGLLIVPILIITNGIFKLFPDKNITEIGYEVYGDWIFKSFLMFILIYAVVFLGFLCRHLGELVKAFLLTNTPIEIIILSFILCTSYISRCDIEVIGRASYHIYPFVIGFVVLLSILTITKLDFTNMLPVFQSNLKNIPLGTFTSFFSYAGFEILLFTLPFAEEKEKTLRASLSGLAIVIVIYLVLFTLTLSQFGVYRLKTQTFATISILKEIDLPGYFIENLDILAMGVWILIIYAGVASMYFMGGKMAAALFKLENHDLFILPLAPFIYMVSLMPHNIFELDEVLGKLVDYMGFMVLVVLPIFTYTIGSYKVRRRRK